MWERGRERELQIYWVIHVQSVLFVHIPYATMLVSVGIHLTWLVSLPLSFCCVHSRWLTGVLDGLGPLYWNAQFLHWASRPVFLFLVHGARHCIMQNWNVNATAVIFSLSLVLTEASRFTRAVKLAWILVLPVTCVPFPCGFCSKIAHCQHRWWDVSAHSCLVSVELGKTHWLIALCIFCC